MYELEVNELRAQIKRAQQRQDKAYAQWDAEAYEGACNRELELRKKLAQLILAGASV